MKTLKESLSAVVLAVFLAAAPSCNNWSPDLNTDVALPVVVQKVKKGSIEEVVTTSGTVRPVREALIKNEVGGLYRLQKNPATGRPYRMGDRVKEGAVIILLEDKEYENNLNITAKKLNMEISKQEYEKQSSLYEKGGVTLRELRNAEVAMINARNDYENALIKLEKLKVKAPFDGYLVDLPYHTGGVRVPAGQEMFRVMAFRKMFLEAHLPEKYLPRIQDGMQVRVTNYVFPQDTLNGRVSQISPALSEETRTFKVRMDIDNPSGVLRPGMFIKSEIILQRKDSVIVIYKNYLRGNRYGRKVFVVENGLARERRIMTGIENDNMVEVVNGLKENESLVVRGYETLRDRTKVKVTMRVGE